MKSLKNILIESSFEFMYIDTTGLDHAEELNDQIEEICATNNIKCELTDNGYKLKIYKDTPIELLVTAINDFSLTYSNGDARVMNRLRNIANKLISLVSADEPIVEKSNDDANHITKMLLLMASADKTDVRDVINACKDHRGLLVDELSALGTTPESEDVDDIIDAIDRLDANELRRIALS